MKDLIIMIVAFVIVAAFVGHMEINLAVNTKVTPH